MPLRDVLHTILTKWPGAKGQPMAELWNLSAEARAEIGKRVHAAKLRNKAKREREAAKAAKA